MYHTLIYLDHAATTPLDPEIATLMEQTGIECWANPSSPHAQGRKARAAIDEARASIASDLGVKSSEVVFTASGSEANCLALFGVCEKYMQKAEHPGHIVGLSIEHSCSLKSFDRLRRQGWEVTLLPVNAEGIVSVKEVGKALQENTAIVSVQWANNEVGSIQPVEEIATVCKEAGVPFHTDAVQAVGQLPLCNLPDLTSIAAHKFYGPKGIGALIVREHVELCPQILGGGQEFSLRSGTEFTPGIVGMAAALNKALTTQKEESARLIALRDDFIAKLEALDGIRINGSRTKRLPNNVNISLADKDGETVVIQLDMQGICAATGSACVTGFSEPSHVIEALHPGTDIARKTVRFSLGKSTTEQDLEAALTALKQIIDQ